MIDYRKIETEYLKKMIKNPEGGKCSEKMEYFWFISPLTEDRYYCLCDGYSLYRIPEDRMWLHPDVVPPSSVADLAIRMAEANRHKWIQVWPTGIETKRRDRHTCMKFDNARSDEEYIYKWIDKKFFNGIFKGCAFATYPGPFSAPVLVFDDDSPDLSTAKFDAFMLPSIINADGTMGFSGQSK